jgi:hypothetical protein
MLDGGGGVSYTFSMSGKNVYVDRLMWSLYLACCLAGLAGGLWFEVWTGRGSAMIPPPSLAGVAMGQGAFFWLALPVLLLRRQQNHRPVELLSAVMTTLLWLAASAPMVMLAGWLGDATWLDGVRAELAVAATAVVGWLGGLLLARAAWRGGLLGGLLVTGLALPMG